MRKVLLTSTALAVALLFSPVNASVVLAQSDKAGKSDSSPGHDPGGPGGSENSPGHDPGGPGNSENAGEKSDRGGSADAPGHDPAGPGESENAPGHNKTTDDGDDDDGDVAGRQSVNPVPILNSKKKLSETIAEVRDLELTDIQVVTFTDQELDIALRGGSARAIRNAVARQRERIESLLSPEELAFFTSELSGVEAEDVVGFAVEGNTLIVYVRS